MQLWNSQNTPKNASESVSYLPEIRFRPGGRSPPGPPTRALLWTHWGPRRPPDPLPVVLPHCSGPSYAPDSCTKTKYSGHLISSKILEFKGYVSHFPDY